MSAGIRVFKVTGRDQRWQHSSRCPNIFMLSVVWKLDRLGRDLRHLINTVHDLTARGTGLKVLTGHGATIDTTTAAGKLVFGIFAALAEFERELIAERTTAGLASARARGRNGGRPYKMTPVKLRLAMASMGQSETKVSTLCQELGITRKLCTGIFPLLVNCGRTGSSCSTVDNLNGRKNLGFRRSTPITSTFLQQCLINGSLMFTCQDGLPYDVLY